MPAKRAQVEDAPAKRAEEVDLRTIEWLKKDLERRRDKEAGVQKDELVSG